MKAHSSPIAGVFTVATEAVADERGTFARLFCSADLVDVIGDRQIRQINYSTNVAAGTVRGMHFQHSPHAEMKLVRCLKGKVWDVAVDLRENSATFLKWHAEELTAANARMLVIPEGCAHGFQVLEADSELLYLHTAPYCKAAEGGVHPLDPRIGIDWPRPVKGLSAADAARAVMAADFKGLHP